jgi:hypothetical protein
VTVQKPLAKLYADRVKAGVCRHCGGSVPCWSPYGDAAIGKRHTIETLNEGKK